MCRRRSVRTLFASSFLMVQLIGPAQANEVAPVIKPAAIELSSCTLPGVAQVARCGVFHVPENLSDGSTRELMGATCESVPRPPFKTE